MKKILITGADSYVGTSFEKWLAQWPDDYHVDSLDMIGVSWRWKDFSQYNAVFHVAGIVHVPSDPRWEALHYKVNRDLTMEAAQKAKAEGVGQFIFMSTMAVYGQEGKIGDDITITQNTKPDPKTDYGKSKLSAEIGLNKLAGNGFKVVIIRSPMIYGTKCPGNYARLERLALRTPIFPMIDNNRSILHIQKLNEYIKEYIDQEAEGIFFPQDSEYANTSLLVRKIAEEHGRKIYLSGTIGRVVKLLGKRINLVNKTFGNLVYDKSLQGRGMILNETSGISDNSCVQLQESFIRNGGICEKPVICELGTHNY